MKKIFTYIFTASIVLGLASCDKIFDSLEGDLSKMYADELNSESVFFMRGEETPG